MARKHDVIYIPGINDHRSFGQKLAIQLWRFYSFTPHYFALGWAKDEGFEAKQTRILRYADGLLAQGHRVSLVAASAGASAALNAYAQRPKIAGVVCICGKIQYPDRVGPAVYAGNPDFRASMLAVAESLREIKRQNRIGTIMSIHSEVDWVVSVEDTVVPGAVEVTLPVRGHIAGIAAGILSVSKWGRFLKTIDR